MFRCRKKKPEVSTSPLPESTSRTGSTSDTVVGLVVGHNKRAQGANNYLGESEWVFNSRIAKKLQSKMNDAGIKSVIVFRPDSGGYRHECRSVAKELEKHGCSYSIHMHFNSAGATARGCEVLVAPTRTDRDDLFGQVFTDILNEKYKFVERGKDGVKTVYKGHNGYGMLAEVKSRGITPVLIEPCFANTRNRESRIIFENEDRYVAVLLEAVRRAWY